MTNCTYSYLTDGLKEEISIPYYNLAVYVIIYALHTFPTAQVARDQQ